MEPGWRVALTGRAPCADGALTIRPDIGESESRAYRQPSSLTFGYRPVTPAVCGDMGDDDMGHLSALVALLGALTLLNLLLTFGIIRRLRTRPANPIVTTPGFLSPGTLIGDFTGHDLDGRPVSRSALSGRTLVGFFSPGCDACRDMLPDFVAAAAAFGRDRTLAIVMSGVASASDYLPALTPVARVVPDDPDGPLISAFAITAFPSFFVVAADGRIVAGGVALDDLPIAAVA
ncbi:hypothetical protein Axi01nite_12960 [Actinoplanes xinjiangensis]|nr:hypothetical protein Axi01nite_12960 [Actinoplanes xinjiangensis]